MLQTEPARSRPVRILVVGGDQIRARYDRAIQAHFACPEVGVEVVFHHTTRQDKGHKHLEHLRQQAAHCDAVVLLEYLRTHLARSLRRHLNQAHLPYVGCAGHGREAIIRGIEAAVARSADGRR